MNRSQFEQYYQNVGVVMSVRLAMLPWWWVSDPVRAEKETRKMFSEKEAAFSEVQSRMALTPTQFWYELWCGFVRGDADGGVGRATRSAELKLISPYTSRVSASRKRLSKG